MSKIPVLTLGYNRFALSGKANITAILTALQDAQAVDYTYEGSRKVFFPEESGHRSHVEISIEYVDPSQFVAINPNKKTFEKPAEPKVVHALSAGKLALGDSRHGA